MIVYSTNDKIVTVINRVLTLSESAYLSLQNYSIQKKIGWYKSFKKLFKKQNGKEKEKIKNEGISMKFLKEKCGIPANISIKHTVM